MNIRHYLPLVGFVVPTVIIGYGFVIPRSCFASSIVGVCVTYYFGLRTLARDYGPAPS